MSGCCRTPPLYTVYMTSCLTTTVDERVSTTECTSSIEMKGKLLMPVVFLICCVQIGAYVYLVGVENATDSVEVFISAESSPGTLSPHTLEGQHLSPACGDGFFRCKLFTKGRILGSIHYYVIVIPLVEKLAILELRYDGDGKEMSLHRTHILEIPCNSTGLIEVRELYYVICVGWNSISVYKISLKSDSIEDSSVDDNAAAELKCPNLDPSSLSNFEYIGRMEGNLQGIIYFSVGQYLYALNPLDNTNLPIGYIKCDVVNLLVYAGNQTLVAYCRNNSVVYFDLDFGRWHNQTDPKYDEYPFPYVCDNSDVHLAVSPTSNSMEYGIWSQDMVRRLDLPGTDIEPMSGVCSDPGTGGNTLFAFGDQQEGVFVMNISLYHDTAIKLSSYGCQNSKCHPQIFDNRYVLVREEGDNKHSVLVSDSLANFTIIMKVAVQANLVTLILSDIPLVTIERPPEKKETNSGTGTVTAIAIVIPLVGVAIIVALVVAVVVHVHRTRESWLASNCTRRRNNTDSNISLQGLLQSDEDGSAETSFNGDSDSETPSILTDVNDQGEDTSADITANEQRDDGLDDPPTLHNRTRYNADGSSESLSGAQQTGIAVQCTDDLPLMPSSDGQVHHAEETAHPPTPVDAPMPLERTQQTPCSDSSEEPAIRIPRSVNNVRSAAANGNELNSTLPLFSNLDNESASASAFQPLSDHIDSPVDEDAVPSNSECVPGIRKC